MLRGLGQGKFGQCAHLELKLRDAARVQTVVGAVVGSRCNFVDDPVKFRVCAGVIVLKDKELNAQNTDIIQSPGQFGAGVDEFITQGRINPIGNDGGGEQNAPTMDVELHG